MSKTILITGASSGLGRALVEAALVKGHRVAATARHTEALQPLVERHLDLATAVALDVADSQSVRAGVEQALAALGGSLDVLVNNAGYGAMGAVEEVDEESVQRQYATNVFGVLHVICACLPTLRRQRAGHIVYLLSLGGMVSFAGTAIYCSTKFAVEGLSEGLAKERPLGIRVTLIEPGAFRTDFSGRSLHTPKHPLKDYAPTAGKWIDDLRANADKMPGDPAKAAAAILEAIESDSPPLRFALGVDAVEGIRQKHAATEQELSCWEEVSRGTAYNNQ